jgi:hypothetical protein
MKQFALLFLACATAVVAQDGIPPAFGDPWSNSRWHPIPNDQAEYRWRLVGVAYVRSCAIQLRSTTGDTLRRDVEIFYVNLDGASTTARLNGVTAVPINRRDEYNGGNVNDCQRVTGVNAVQ